MIGPVELIVAAFNDESKAAEVLKALKQLQKDEIISLINAAVMVKDAHGKVSVKETQDVRTGQGALFGAVAGGLIGLLGGPVGVVLGAAAGAATGGVAAHKIDMGFPDDTLAELKESLKPGTSAILALIQHQWVDRVVEELQKEGAALFRQQLKEELAAQLEAGEMEEAAESDESDESIEPEEAVESDKAAQPAAPAEEKKE
jgi:uncharacterized membrane protein